MIQISIESNSKEDKSKKRANLMNNAMLVENWIKNFDSKSINDCFDNRGMNTTMT